MIISTEVLLILSMFSFAIGYIEAGINPGWTPPSAETILAAIYAKSDTDTGVQRGNYSAEKNAEAQSTYEGVTKVGPMSGNYDPELASWLTSEGV